MDDVIQRATAMILEHDAPRCDQALGIAHDPSESGHGDGLFHCTRATGHDGHCADTSGAPYAWVEIARELLIECESIETTQIQHIRTWLDGWAEAQDDAVRAGHGAPEACRALSSALRMVLDGLDNGWWRDRGPWRIGLVALEPREARADLVARMQSSIDDVTGQRDRFIAALDSYAMECVKAAETAGHVGCLHASEVPMEILHLGRELDTTRARYEAALASLAQCFLLSGADPTDACTVEDKARRAVVEVQVLRDNYDEAGEDEAKLRRRIQILEAAMHDAAAALYAEGLTGRAILLSKALSEARDPETPAEPPAGLDRLVRGVIAAVEASYDRDIAHGMGDRIVARRPEGTPVTLRDLRAFLDKGSPAAAEWISLVVRAGERAVSLDVKEPG